MRKRTVVKGILLVALITMSVLPAKAGPYVVDMHASRGAYIEGTVPGGRAVVALFRFDGPYSAGKISIIPIPVPNTHLFVPTTVPNGEGPRYVGCIMIVLRVGFDGSCSVLPPATIGFDNLLVRGNVTFAVDSRAVAGRRVTANLLLTGIGDYAPFKKMDDPTKAASPTPSAGNPKPNLISFNGEAALSRTASVLGSVRSDVYGGGALRATKTVMLSGVSGTLTWHSTKLLCQRSRPTSPEVCSIPD